MVFASLSSTGLSSDQVADMLIAAIGGHESQDQKTKRRLDERFGKAEADQ